MAEEEIVGSGTVCAAGCTLHAYWCHAVLRGSRIVVSSADDGLNAFVVAFKS